MKKPNVFWRFCFRVTVAVARWTGFDTIDWGKRLSSAQQEWIESLGYLVYDVVQDEVWSNHMVYIGM